MLLPSLTHAQGSIFGSVQNSDLSIPPAGAVTFFGFLDDTDEEIRLESSTGAGYDAGNWFDDFQNYLTEAAGNPYDYYFFNASEGQGYHLNGAIPNNSFQQEDIQLAPLSWPSQPVGVRGSATVDSTIIIAWNYDPTVTMHVYRRPAASDGSFFRIDNLAGDLTDPGVADSTFTDVDVDGASSYDYVLIAENASGQYSPHSTIVTVNAGVTVCCVGDAGDINGDNVNADPLDLTFLVDYMFQGGVAPECEAEADLNGDGAGPTPLDLTYFVDYVFNGGVPPVACP